MRLVSSLIIILALAAGSPGLAAQGKGRGRAAQGNADVESQGDDHGNSLSVSVSIGRNDERLIRTWFSEPRNMQGLPPGLAKKEHLPPGLQRQLVRNGKLPLGLEKKIEPPAFT